MQWDPIEMFCSRHTYRIIYGLMWSSFKHKVMLVLLKVPY